LRLNIKYGNISTAVAALKRKPGRRRENVTDERDHDDTYLLLGSDFMSLLSSNGLTLGQVLKTAGIDDLREVPDPAHTEGQREVFMVLIGSAAIVAAVTPLITNVVKTLVNRPVVTRSRTLAPATDKSGKVLVGKDGQPLMQWSDTVAVDRAPPTKEFTSKIKTTKDGVEINVGPG
jgi:hypothetical protein